MAEPLKAKEIAKFAAEGVAIALKARDQNFRGPFHIICGLPPDDIFQVELGNQQGAVAAVNVKEFKLGT